MSAHAHNDDTLYSAPSQPADYAPDDLSEDGGRWIVPAIIFALSGGVAGFYFGMVFTAWLFT